MTWRAIRTAGLVFLLIGGFVYLSNQKAGAHEVPSPCFDFVTGGGWFAPAGAGPDRANFGFNAGFKGPNQTEPSGHLNYIDHNDGMHVSSTSVDTYEAFACEPDCADRRFTGTAKVNGVSGFSYAVEVIDAGEPGNAPKGKDRFIITVSGPGLGYHADSGGFGSCSGDSCGIDGGNIEIHKSCTE